MLEKQQKYNKRLSYKEHKALLEQEDTYLKEKIHQHGRIIKKDVQTWLISAGTFYLSYRLVRSFFKSSKPKNRSHTKEIIVKQEQNHSPNTSSSVFKIIKSKAVEFAADMAVEQLKDIITSQKNRNEG